VVLAQDRLGSGPKLHRARPRDYILDKPAGNGGWTWFCLSALCAAGKYAILTHVRALAAIREPKRLVLGGAWHDGKMPRSAFPLSKSHSYLLGSSWRWLVWNLAASGRKFRLLVAYDHGKAQYRAWLGLEAVDGDQAILARLEHHPSHKGWHCHVKRGPIDQLGYGVVRHPNIRENGRLCADKSPFQVSDVDALGIACRAFNIEASIDGGELFG